jgi:hypothetical protein
VTHRGGVDEIDDCKQWLGGLLRQQAQVGIPRGQLEVPAGRLLIPKKDDEISPNRGPIRPRFPRLGLKGDKLLAANPGRRHPFPPETDHAEHVLAALRSWATDVMPFCPEKRL